MKAESLSFHSISMAEKILFLKNKVHFRLADSKRLSSWINRIAKNEGFKIASLTFIFCSDRFVHAMNKKFLNHDELTDILTFDLSEKRGDLSGEIYISIDRVKDNATKFKVSFGQELKRVIIHGVLHLIGFDDKSVVKAQKMRDKEDACLSLY